MITHSRNSRGVALVIVLGVIVLVLGLIVAFVSRAGSERSSSSSYTAANSSRNLADLAVNLVQGQINDATTQGSDKAWASQPGAIRVYDTNGSLNRIFRLYSAGNLTASAAGDLANDLPPATWATDNALWCDLNAPGIVDGATVFPILDPAAATGADAVKGFSINATTQPAGTSATALPMPVRWLYVLKDGTIVAPTGNGTTATVAGGSKNNPITGRIAFWTDDDTCRVNINTASEGTYWAAPRFYTISTTYNATDTKMADFQPAQKEFQRYPGHPAMTSLSAVFPTLTADQIYGIVPRVIGGGSNGGTAVATAALTPDSDRLYSSVGELLYNKDRGSNGLTKPQLEKAKFFLTAQSRAPEVNLFSKPRISIWPITQGMPTAKTTYFDKLIAFCSTIQNPPPGQLYYFQRNNPNKSDELAIANNADLYSYLQYFTGQPFPGFGGNFNSKYPSDRDQILTEIFDYIRCTNLNDYLISDTNTIPGNRFTPGFRDNTTTSKYLTGHGWVAPTIKGSTQGFGRTFTLSELAIGFICNADGNDGTGGSNIPLAPDHIADGNIALGGSFTRNGTGVIISVTANGTALLPGEKYIQAIIVPELFTVMAGWTGLCAGNMTIEITGLDLLSVTANGTTANLGFPGNGTASYRWSGANLFGGSSSAGAPIYRYAFHFKQALARGNFPADITDPNKSPYPFISVPVKLAGLTANSTMSFSGGNITVTLRNPDASGAESATGTVVQTLKLNLPGGTFPIPRIADVDPKHYDAVTATTSTTPKSMWWAFSGPNGRLNYTGNKASDPGTMTEIWDGAFFNKNFDVVRSIVPRHGDCRVIAATHTLDDPTNQIFKKHPDYDDSSKPMAHMFSGPSVFLANNFIGSDTGGKYISGNTYGQGVDIPRDVAAADRPEATGDFDIGVLGANYGPYVNKPDEGNNFRASSYTTHPYFATTDYAEGPGSAFFSPNRQMPSPGMFGSLPTGVKAGVPWKTLLFRPQGLGFPTSGMGLLQHPSSSTTIPDHLIMDLFWMPVVEPYAISEPFSTAGKINMNYQIQPFTYVTRSTGIQALLKNEKVAVMDSGYPLAVDPTETLKQFQLKFDANDLFKSATEICDIHIIPTGVTLDATGSDAGSKMCSFWNSGTSVAAAHSNTGDNLRELIYTTLYPRLTTKSNSFTVYFTVQALRNPTAVAQNTWNESTGKIISEYRGSTSLERYIDPADTAIPNYLANPSSSATLDKFYRWRITGNRQFAP